MTEAVRVDKWLWAARFFKTRSLARQAIDGGKIQLNGHRVKPAKVLSIGDKLRIQRGYQIFEVIVEDLESRRGPAQQAQTLYAETAESLALRTEIAQQRRMQNLQGNRPSRRPDKKQRRQIHRFKGSGRY